jgi:exonuclease III
MIVFYLNCHCLLKRSKDGQRDWLLKTVIENNVDVVCLSESSNYDFSIALPDPFKKEYRWIAPKSTLAKMGYKFNICSKYKVIYKSIDYSVDNNLLGDGDPTELADYGMGTMISLKFKHFDFEIVPVHIQHKKSKSQTLSPKNAFYNCGLTTLRDYMIKNNPMVVFGDFNNYPNDKLFLDLTDGTGYRNAKVNEVPYTYKKGDNDPGMIIDHAFTNSDNVSMKYIPAIEYGFDHHGMLITIRTS